MRLTLERALAQEMQNPDFALAYGRLDPAYQVARQVIELRAKQNLTQRTLAERIGTKQSSISRLESLASAPSLSFLQRIAEALDAELKIQFIPRQP